MLNSTGTTHYQPIVAKASLELTPPQKERSLMYVDPSLHEYITVCMKSAFYPILNSGM